MLQYARVVIDVRINVHTPSVQASLYVIGIISLSRKYLILNLDGIQCATSDPDGRKRALLIGGGIANFTDVAATFNGIIRALREKVRNY